MCLMEWDGVLIAVYYTVCKENGKEKGKKKCHANNVLKEANNYSFLKIIPFVDVGAL